MSRQGTMENAKLEKKKWAQSDDGSWEIEQKKMFKTNRFEFFA